MHAAYWKYVVWRRLTGEKRGSFPLEGSNWFVRERADAGVWKADLRLLDDCHRRLRETVASLDPKRLRRSVGGSTTALDLVTGIIAHDMYHAGSDPIAQADAHMTPTRATGSSASGLRVLSLLWACSSCSWASTSSPG